MPKIIKAGGLAAAGVLALAACGHPAAPAAAPTSTPTSVAAATPPAAATAPAAAATTSPTPDPATAAVLWCGPVGSVLSIPGLAAWKVESGVAENEAGSPITDLRATVADIESMTVPGGQFSTSSNVLPFAEALCGEVRAADAEPPPADLGDYSAAMSAFLAASEMLKTVPGGTPASAEAAVRPDLDQGTAELSSFLTAIGN